MKLEWVSIPYKGINRSDTQEQKRERKQDQHCDRTGYQHYNTSPYKVTADVHTRKQEILLKFYSLKYDADSHFSITITSASISCIFAYTADI